MINKLFNSKINSITSAAIIVAAASMTSRFLGIFRDRILAGEFGAGDTLDIYYAAFRIPDLVYNLIVLGALSAGFIPVFTALCRKNSVIKKIFYSAERCQNEAWQVANAVVNLLGATLIILSAVFIVFAPQLTRLMTPGFGAEKQLLTVTLTRIMFCSPLLLGISSVFGGILQSFKRFFVYSLAPIMYNIGIIAGALYFVPLWGIYGLAYGVVLGALLHLIIQLPAAFALGYRYGFTFNWRNKHVSEIIKMMVPRTLSLAINQINLVVVTVVASTLAAGSLAVFNLANNLQSFPVGIFGISFAVAAFPTLSELVGDKEALIKNFSKVLRQIIFFILPATVFILTLRVQIIRIILGSGQFDWQDTILTMDALTLFSLSLFAQAALPLLTRMFYAQKNSRTPFWVGLIATTVNICLCFWFAPRLGIAGLALAFSLSTIVNFILLWLILKISLGELDEWNILYSTLKISLASVGAGLAVQAMKLIVGNSSLIDMHRFWGVTAQAAIAGVFGLLIFILMCWVLRAEELMNFVRSIRERTKREKVATDDVGEARGI
ncbi:murein biosynthesis integral membrane protein MurJ [Candidatus Falkowbacteria bacterium CG10_big_fil_rev_8_21_14_0_10_43_11]|uniref:Probable lipid II flippase MurJ n=1 Tax=Candidatus Falkowbacteria bacterium CG10_big_fil_rev_8_21_14_0_10_43_11 TaxID=1974568 RepID=A0A2M6WM74_9BACT|nr:MAG: murein biosynthesis integral membrane protein MurJ [Candidatus Omnitrophica bacterium CG1_02_46_14]PIT93885.1 MAG: murein biosynthesis integral membrane protein MurJ [Candidatus Falkowbacteria bacterium CG10_big_fil_rev_8_21_14_0_10_43_11]